MQSLIFALAVTPALAAPPAEDHAAMERDHAAAFEDHRTWERDLGEMRARHKGAIATLRRLEAEILDHEADIDRRLMEIAEHRSEMLAHDAEIEGHEDGAAGEEHDRLAAEHAEIKKRHDAMKRTVGADAEHHEALMRQIEALGKKHSHGHGHTRGDE